MFKMSVYLRGGAYSSFLGNGNGFEKSTHKLISTRYYTCKGKQCLVYLLLSCYLYTKGAS